MPAGGGILVGIDEKNHPQVTLGLGEWGSGVEEEGNSVLLGGDADVCNIVAP